MAENEDRPIGDWPNISAEMWLTLAIVFGFFTAIGCSSMLIWILSDQTPATMAARARVFTPVAALSVALVTFFTIAWRGKITERQVRVAQDQLQETQNQNTAELLQKGAELIWEEVESTETKTLPFMGPQTVVTTTPRLGKATAGIATLGIVAKGIDDKLAIQAMNILADFLHKNFADNHDSALCLAVIEALRAGEESSQPDGIYRIANRAVTFRTSEDSTYWSVVGGIRNVVFKGGTFSSVRNGEFSLTGRGALSYTFAKVRFMDCGIDFNFTADACSFRYCNIRQIRTGQLRTNEFKHCDFSSCNFVGVGNIPDMRAGGNYFRPDYQPEADFDFDWKNKLHVGRPKK